ncbi:MAG: heavy metal translocating P-type ATPase, partial [Candidatus Lokiarchaeota archaeon]|nr:heavy metal translocating P-type ATPase [Candidatus Lokiarchaeota archaeon]
MSQFLAFLSIFLSGPGVVKEAIEDVREKKITANILMIIAAVASFFILHGQEGATALLLYSIAERLEEITTEKSQNAIKDLLELAPDEALLKRNGEYTTVHTDEVKPGDIIGVKPGMKVPLDGEIVKGKSYFDESAITGESIPIFKKKGDLIFAASLNSDSFVDVRITSEKSETVVAKIAQSIQYAQLNKSKKEKFIERFARYYTPIILIAALFVMVFPPFFLNLDFNEWFYRGLILLVVSCPCALTLSTPLANISALTKLAREGILVKGNRFIEQVDDIEIFAFDKTGTLTEGNLRVFNTYSYLGNDLELLKIAASLETLSEHPIGKAIVREAKRKEVQNFDVNNFNTLKGKGVKGEINGELYHAGSESYFNEMNYELPEEDLKKIQESGTLPVLIANEKELMGIITIRDVLRISAPILIKNLKNRGYKTTLISGDRQVACNTIGECLDIDQMKGELLPDQKLSEIKNLKQNYNGVAMVGDGINDAPALALSDLGIAIGASATDLTLETADVIIMNDDLKKIIDFIEITKKTNRIIKQNIWTSIIVKVSFAILTVLGFMTLWLAVGIGDMGVSLLVMANSMRIFRHRLKTNDIEPVKYDNEAKMLICENCRTKNIIPQHHGRDMLKDENG